MLFVQKTNVSHSGHQEDFYDLKVDKNRFWKLPQDTEDYIFTNISKICEKFSL